MRLGGLFPLPITDVYSGGGVIDLPSGLWVPLPAGMYIVAQGGVSTLQHFNPVNGQWDDFGIDTGSYNEISVPDGANVRLINMSGVVQGASITNAGSGGTNGIGALATGVSVSFAAPGSPGLTATAYPIVGGSVAAPTVNQAGSGFLVPPLVIIDPPPFGGIQATAHAVLTAPGGGISSIVMDNVGAGYVGVPNFYLISLPQFYQGGAPGGTTAGAFPPPGIVAAQNLPQTGAYQFGYPTTSSAAALLNAATLTGSGTLTGIVMTGYGSNYTGTTIPAVTITGAGGAAATAIMSFVVTSVSLVSGGAGYGAGAPPIWETSLGLVANINNSAVMQPRAARGVTTVGGGAVATLPIEDQGFGLQKVPTVAIINTSAIASGQATATAVCGGVVDQSIVQAKIIG